MKNYKVMSLLLILVMAVSLLSGCGKTSTDDTAGTEEEQVAVNAQETPEEVTEETLEGALEGVTLKVGTSGLFAPFSYYDEAGKELIGYDVDFLNALQDLLGFDIENDTVEAMDYAALAASVAEGKLDIAMAALCATDQRKEVMNFSDTYYDSGQITVINEETSPKTITGIDSLTTGDYLVAVEKGTASHLYAQENIPVDKIEVHDTITTAYESLEQGKVDTLLQDTPGIAYYIKTKEGTKLAMVGDEFNQGQAPYAIAVSFKASKEHEGIEATFNKAIAQLIEDGTMSKIDATWCK